MCLETGPAPDIVQWPVQTAFEVVYAPWDIGGGVRVAETRRVTLDAGNRFSKVRSVLNVRGTETVKAVWEWIPESAEMIMKRLWRTGSPAA